jgi:hypothetical protein
MTMEVVSLGLLEAEVPMNAIGKLKVIGLRCVSGVLRPMASRKHAESVAADQVALTQLFLLQLKRDLDITPAEHPQWSVFSSRVLVQIERISVAREAARGTSIPDPAHAVRKRELTRQVIATPEVLSQAARDLYGALTPEQQRNAGDKLLNFHRRLVG